MTLVPDYSGPIRFHRQQGPSAETLLINDAYRHLLSGAGLLDFSALWSAPGDLVKKRGERSVLRIKVPAAIGGTDTIVLFLKKHQQQLNPIRMMRSRRRQAEPCGEGPAEFFHYCRFRQAGLASAEPVAAGSRVVSAGRLDSFLLTRDFSPLVALEEIILRQPERLQGEENAGKRTTLLVTIGRYARRMHDSGMNQKDFNATHLLLDNPESDRPLIALFDLQRVDRNRLNSWRWPLKALAELNYTLPTSIFNASERLLLFRAYTGKETLSPLDRCQLWLIRRKTAQIARHSRKRGLAPKMTE
ncbi:MAG: lipopolysaccharide kinase InaA family protein [Thermodesulfobacteriota bacterium]